jgi:hypothetical protein
MQPKECLACRGNNFFHGRTTSGLIPSLALFLGRPAFISASACLSCGFVHTHLAEEQLAKVKTWKAKQ